MGKPTGFIELKRKKPPKRNAKERIGDYREVEATFDVAELQEQAAR